MQRYANRSGSSPILGFDSTKDSIKVYFADGPTYVYDVKSAGRPHIAEMQRLAAEGTGLAAYISRHTRQLYARKLSQK